MGLTVVKELGLERHPRLTSDLHQFLNYLMEFEGTGAKKTLLNPSHHPDWHR
jgi:hypothetical protein